MARDGSPGALYDATRDVADGAAFADRGAGDRHQFRIIVAPEDAAEYDDLRGYVRRLMAQVESDLGTRLDWVAADHHDTGHPHTHLVIRGMDERGKDLIIAREYVAHGMRARAQEIVSRDLGPRTDREIEERLVNEVGQERLTSLDRGLLREARDHGGVDARWQPAHPHAALRHSLRVGRLRKLERLGLAAEISPGVFRLASDLEPILRHMGERGDVIRTIQRTLSAKRLERASEEFAVLQPGDGRLIGRVVGRGMSDELHERHYLIVDGLDGRTHYADIGRSDLEEPIREGTVVAIAPADPARPGTASRVERLSEMPVDRLATADAATWLDQDVATTSAAARDAGFGREVRAALAQRQLWLIEQGLAESREDGVAYRRDLPTILRRRELARSATVLSKELGLDYAEAGPGRLVQGTYRRRVDLVSGRFAVLANVREFTLVPWRPELERRRDRTIAGRIVGEDFLVSGGRGRQVPTLPSM